MNDVIRHGRQEPMLPGVTARPWSPVHEECDREIEQAERDLGEARQRLADLAEYLDPARLGQRSWVTAYVIATAKIEPRHAPQEDSDHE